MDGEMLGTWPWPILKYCSYIFRWGWGLSENYEVPVRRAAQDTPLTQSKTADHSTANLVPAKNSKYFYYRTSFTKYSTPTNAPIVYYILV
jgi:hypothetical protein